MPFVRVSEEWLTATGAAQYGCTLITQRSKGGTLNGYLCAGGNRATHQVWRVVLSSFCFAKGGKHASAGLFTFDYILIMNAPIFDDIRRCKAERCSVVAWTL